MVLRFDPFQIFKSSRTPAGLYARQKWLDGENTKSWITDSQTTIRELLSGQSNDGSWGHSIINTVQRIFGLHLTVRTQTEPIKKALDWLMDQASSIFPRTTINRGENIDPKDLRDLPFTQGCSGLFLTGSALFLSSIFGRENDSEVLKLYQWLNSKGVRNKGRWCGWSCSNNILRAFVVHPQYCKSKATVLAVDALARAQSQSGVWLKQVPFYKTINALAHLDLVQADVQLERAFERLYKTQRRDGTWGRINGEWNTFLIVHALKNKKEL